MRMKHLTSIKKAVKYITSAFAASTIFLSACAGTNAVIERIDSYEEIDWDGVPIGFRTTEIYLDNKWGYVEICGDLPGRIREGDTIPYISWDWQPRLWMGNYIDEIKLMDEYTDK